MSPKPDNNESSHGEGSSSWPERNVNTIVIALVIACGLTLVAPFVFGLGFDDEHKAHFEQEKWFAFQAIFGFVAFVAVVFLGRGLRFIVKRPEDYYDA